MTEPKSPALTMMDDEEGYRKKKVAEWRMRQDSARIYTAKRRSVYRVTWAAKVAISKVWPNRESKQI